MEGTTQQDRLTMIGGTLGELQLAIQGGLREAMKADEVERDLRLQCDMVLKAQRKSEEMTQQVTQIMYNMTPETKQDTRSTSPPFSISKEYEKNWSHVIDTAKGAGPELRERLSMRPGYRSEYSSFRWFR